MHHPVDSVMRQYLQKVREAIENNFDFLTSLVILQLGPINYVFSSKRLSLYIIEVSADTDILKVELYIYPSYSFTHHSSTHLTVSLTIVLTQQH